MNQAIFKRKASLLSFALLCLAVIATLPYFNYYLVNGHDSIYHITRIEGIYHSLADGHYLARINPIQTSGYGYASGILYPQLFLYIPAFLRFFDISLINCYKILILLINITTAFISYFSFQRLLKSSQAGLIGAALYTLSLYRVTNIYVRGAVGEVLAMSFLPLAVYGMYEILCGDSRKWKWLVAAYTGIIQSHILSLLLTAFFCAIAVIIALPILLKNTKRLFALLKAALFTLLINLWFLIPFLQYYLLDLNVHTNNNYLPQSAVSLSQLFTSFLPATLGMDQPLLNTKGEMIQSVGLIFVFTTILFLLKPFAWNHTDSNADSSPRSAKTLNVFLALGLFSLWLSSILFPWNTIMSISWLSPIAASIQFVWRFLAYATLFLSIVGAQGLSEWLSASTHNKNAHFLGLIFSLFIIIFSIQPFLDSTTQMDSLDTTEIQGSSSVGLGGSDELYLFKRDYISDLETRSQEFIASEGTVFTYQNYERYGCRLLVDIYVAQASDDAFLDVPLYYYPNYQGWINGSEVSLSRGDAGTIRVPITEGTWHLEIDFTEAPLWILCDIISVLSFFALAFLWLKGSRRLSLPH